MLKRGWYSLGSLPANPSRPELRHRVRILKRRITWCRKQLTAAERYAASMADRLKDEEAKLHEALELLGE